MAKAFNSNFNLLDILEDILDNKLSIQQLQSLEHRISLMDNEYLLSEIQDCVDLDLNSKWKYVTANSEDEPSSIYFLIRDYTVYENIFWRILCSLITPIFPSRSILINTLVEKGIKRQLRGFTCSIINDLSNYTLKTLFENDLINHENIINNIIPNLHNSQFKLLTINKILNSAGYLKNELYELPQYVYDMNYKELYYKITNCGCTDNEFELIVNNCVGNGLCNEKMIFIMTINEKINQIC